MAQETLVFQPKTFQSRTAAQKHFVGCGTFVCMLAFLASPALAETKPASLAQYIPEDVWLFSHTWRTPERDKIVQNWDEVINALKTCGIEQELRKAIYTTIPDEKQPAFESKWNEISAAFGAVEWVDLVCNEFVFAERFKSAMPDIIIIARPKPETFQKNVKGLIGIFDLFNTYATGSPKPAKVSGRLRTWSIRSDDGDIGLHLLHIDDKVALVFGQSALTDVHSLLLGEKRVASILNNERFKKAMTEVPKPDFSVTFMDIDRVFQWVTGLPSLILGKHEHTAPIQTISGIIATVTNKIDFIDYIVMSQEVKGNKQIQHTVARVKSNCCQKPCAKAFSQQKPVKNFTRFVPAESKSYVVSAMFDLRVFYDTLLEIIRNEIPEGAGVCRKWEDVQRDAQFNVRGDLLDWISGEFVAVAFPPVKQSSFAQEDGAMLFRIRDVELARQKIPKLVDRATTLFQNSGQQLTVSPASSLPVEGFQKITVPTMVMFIGTPCFGVWDEWFVVGSSEDAVALIMKTAAGEHPSIVTNERFKREGLSTDQPVVGASFTDLSNIGQELSAAFFGFGFAAGMIPNEPEAAPAKAILSSLVRLGPVVNKIDFLSSSSTLTTFKDNAWHVESVTTYKSADE